MSNAAPEILQVVDTRQYEEQGDRWVPIPGSGNAHECDRCGRMHEVHATVKYADGSVKVVGTGCMDLGKDIARKLATKASTRARYAAQLKAAEIELARVTELEAQVNALVAPPITDGPEEKWGPTWECGDARVGIKYALVGGTMDERRATVVRHWRNNRLVELNGGKTPKAATTLRYLVEDIARKLKRAGG